MKYFIILLCLFIIKIILSSVLLNKTPSSFTFSDLSIYLKSCVIINFILSLCLLVVIYQLYVEHQLSMNSKFLVFFGTIGDLVFSSSILAMYINFKNINTIKSLNSTQLAFNIYNLFLYSFILYSTYKVKAIYDIDITPELNLSDYSSDGENDIHQSRLGDEYSLRNSFNDVDDLELYKYIDENNL